MMVAQYRHTGVGGGWVMPGQQGQNVVRTDAMLLEKIEELTLHAIALSSRLEHAERIIAELLVKLSVPEP